MASLYYVSKHVWHAKKLAPAPFWATISCGSCTANWANSSDSWMQLAVTLTRCSLFGVWIQQMKLYMLHLILIYRHFVQALFICFSLKDVDRPSDRANIQSRAASMAKKLSKWGLRSFGQTEGEYKRTNNEACKYKLIEGSGTAVRKGD